MEHEHLGRIIAAYKALGFRTAIDDFGAGYSGLTLLAKSSPTSSSSTWSWSATSTPIG